MNNIRQKRVETGFSDRLKKCAEKQKLFDAVALAKALDENQDLESILLIGKRSDTQSLIKEDGSHATYRHSNKVITAGSRRYLSILRQVQKHWKTEDVFKVSHMYILAYSTQFNCSTDYLYGLTDVPTANMEDKEICEKAGITEKALLNLRSITLSYLDHKSGITASTKGSKPYITSQILSSPLFAELIDSLHTLDYYISRHTFLNAKKDKTLSDNRAAESSHCDDSNFSEGEYDEAAENEFVILQDSIDENYLRVRTARFESQEFYMLLLDDIFPTLKDFKIKIESY